jgi:hypothetical protein
MRRPAAVILAVIVGLLVAYPLSVGPAWFVFQYFNWGPTATYTLQEGLVLFYSPLDLLPDSINNWIVDWADYGGDLGAAWGHVKGTGPIIDGGLRGAG